MINTYFVCATLYDNLGDLIINKMLIDELCKYGKVYVDTYHVPVHFSKHLLVNPNTIDVYANYHVSAKRVGIGNMFRYYSFLKNNMIGLVTRSPGPVSEPNLKIRLGFKLVNYIAKLSGAKVAYFGNCCSAHIPKNEILRNNGANQIFMRSNASVNFAKKFLDNVDYIPDMAYLLPIHKNPKTVKKVIVDYRSSENENDESLTELQILISEFRKRGYAVEIYYQVASDKDHADLLYSKLKDEGVTFRSNIVWFDDLDYYKDKSFVISNRLHSLITGAAYGAIPIARISSDYTMLKIKHVFNSSFSDNLNSYLGVESKINVSYLIENENTIRSSLYEEMLSNHDLCEMTILQYLTKLLK